VLHNFIERD